MQTPSARDESGTMSPQPRSRARRAVLWLTLLACLALLWLLAPRLASDRMFQNDDFVEYWTAGRLTRAGQNPYDERLVEPFQRALGRTQAVMMWNPPHALAPAMLLSALAYPAARLLWLLLSVAAIFMATLWLWGLYGAGRKTLWWALAVAFCFFPTLDALQKGQISPLILLGLAGFLRYERAGKLGVAGAFAALTSVKPHWMYLFWVALLLWSARGRQWRAIGAAGGVIALGVALAALANPRVLGQYAEAALTRSPLYWATPTLGGALRSALGAQWMWLQFLPALVGLAWLGYEWRRRRAAWVWQDRLPGIALASALTAVYGWTFDQVTLLVAILPAVALLLALRPRGVAWALGAAGLLINVAALLPTASASYASYWWLAPAWAAWCALVHVAYRSRGGARVALPDPA